MLCCVVLCCVVLCCVVLCCVVLCCVVLCCVVLCSVVYAHGCMCVMCYIIIGSKNTYPPISLGHKSTKLEFLN